MVPTKRTDEVFESILCNKAPIELQKQIKEIKVGSVQELLHKLLGAVEGHCSGEESSW